MFGRHNRMRMHLTGIVMTVLAKKCNNQCMCFMLCGTPTTKWRMLRKESYKSGTEPAEEHAVVSDSCTR